MAINGRRNGSNGRSGRSGRSPLGKPDGAPGRRVCRPGRTAGRDWKGNGTLISIGGPAAKEGAKPTSRKAC